MLINSNLTKLGGKKALFRCSSVTCSNFRRGQQATHVVLLGAGVTWCLQELYWWPLVRISNQFHRLSCPISLASFALISIKTVHQAVAPVLFFFPFKECVFSTHFTHANHWAHIPKGGFVHFSKKNHQFKGCANHETNWTSEGFSPARTRRAAASGSVSGINSNFSARRQLEAVCLSVHQTLWQSHRCVQLCGGLCSEQLRRHRCPNTGQSTTSPHQTLPSVERRPAGSRATLIYYPCTKICSQCRVLINWE